MPPFANPKQKANQQHATFKLDIDQLVIIQYSHSTYRFSMTGTSTACNVFGRRREPGLSAPHPAAHPNFPKKSSFFSGKQIGAAQCSGRRAEM